MHVRTYVHVKEPTNLSSLVMFLNTVRYIIYRYLLNFSRDQPHTPQPSG